MGATLTNENLTWATKQDLKEMDEIIDQWAIICVMGETSDGIDGVIEDLTDLPHFAGMTSDDDFFDIARL